MTQTGIYEIVNTVNGKRYVGSAIDLGGRKRAHFSALKSGTHHSEHMQRAWVKYGMDAFSLRTLLLCAPTNLLMYEQRVIDGLNPEYNIAKTAGSPLGIKHTDRARANMSAAGKGRKKSPEWRANMSAALKGNKRFLGHTHTVETLAKLSAAKIGNKYCLGRVVSAETRALMSAANIGRGRPWSAARRSAYERSKEAA